MKKRGGSTALFNVITLFALIGTICIGGFAVFVFLNPGVLPNSFQPLDDIPTVPALPPPPTFTATAVQKLPPTWTPEAIVPTFTPTATQEPTNTSVPEAVATTPSGPTDTTPKAPSDFAFKVQEGNPLAIQNVTHQELGCNWMGVAGQAFDVTGAPVVGITVQLGGSLLDIPMEMLSLTGAAVLYGPGGYEFTLLDGTIGSTQSLYVQLLDQNGLPLSDKVFFDTFTDCEKALILINFQQVQ